MAHAKSHSNECKRIAQNVRYGSKKGHRTSNGWSRDPHAKRKAMHCTASIDGYEIKYTVAKNGVIKGVDLNVPDHIADKFLQKYVHKMRKGVIDASRTHRAGKRKRETQRLKSEADKVTVRRKREEEATCDFRAPAPKNKRWRKEVFDTAPVRKRLPKRAKEIKRKTLAPTVG
jgi:hypothetical protein